MRGRSWRLAAPIGIIVPILLIYAAPSDAVLLTDTTGRQVNLAATPQRIAALIPSALETLFALGAGLAVVGRGASGAIFPPEASALPVVDSLEALIRLRPDLIISHPNHHRFSPPVLEQLGIPLLLLRHQSVAEVMANIGLLGAVTDRSPQAEGLLKRLDERVRFLKDDRTGSKPRVLLLFGTPRSFFAMGEETYAGDLLRLAGAENVASQLPRNRTGGGFHPLSLETIIRSGPEWILVISHGDAARVTDAYHKELEGHPAWRQLPAVAFGRVRALPDDLFATAPGPRLDQALAHLQRILFTASAHAP